MRALPDPAPPRPPPAGSHPPTPPPAPALPHPPTHPSFGLPLPPSLLHRSDMQRFGRIVKLTAFKPFANAADSLEQINAVSESQLTDELKNFLTLNLPKVGAVV